MPIIEEGPKPTVRVSTVSTARPAGVGPIRSLELEYRWIKDHSREHSGDWVALLGDQLLIASSQLDDVMEYIAQHPSVEESLVHLIP